MYGGGDPLDVLDAARRSRLARALQGLRPRGRRRRSREQGLGYLAAVRAQLFCELGTGGVDFPAVVAALDRHGYDGWIVVEQDVFPGYGAPAESARRAANTCDAGDLSRFRRSALELVTLRTCSLGRGTSRCASYDGASIA